MRSALIIIIFILFIILDPFPQAAFPTSHASFQTQIQDDDDDDGNDPCAPALPEAIFLTINYETISCACMEVKNSGEWRRPVGYLRRIASAKDQEEPSNA